MLKLWRQFEMQMELVVDLDNERRLVRRVLDAERVAGRCVLVYDNLLFVGLCVDLFKRKK